jgi:hypothetical protein
MGGVKRPVGLTSAEALAEDETLTGDHGVIRWHKELLPDGTPKWYAEYRGERVAEAVMTGRRGVDNYPWDWYTVSGPPMASGAADTLRSAKDMIATVRDRHS